MTYRFACAQDPLPEYNMELVASPAHIALALEAAEKSAVLLKNDGVLPLSKSVSVAVLGKLAALENTGDGGSSNVRPPYIITPLAGLVAAVGANRIATGDEDDLPAAKAAAAASDVVVVVVGNTREDEGEFIPGDIALGADVPDELRAQARAVAIGGDRDNLGLRAEQVALIEAAVETGKPVVVVIISGSAILVEGWHGKVGAIMQTFYAGMEGGNALAKLLFGDVSPSGKLPFTVAQLSEDYPYFDKDADVIDYDLWHGYTLFDRSGSPVRYAFGHGLSYTTFGYRALKARVAGDYIQVQVCVTNHGKVAGDEVVQVYIGPPGKDTERQKKLLKGFQRITLAPGATKTVRVDLPVEILKWRDPATHSWRLEHGEYSVSAGGASDALMTTNITL